MLYDMELKKRWDNQNALDFKLKQGLEQGRREERAKADQEIAKLQARAEAEKLEGARTLKKSGVELNVISSSLNLPLGVVEKL
ncbi:hypothetical protein SAMN05216436_103244 [bacterium A37T11]|nr:hypothetical protein SAMN05216436_103244 [bacterium A37T11]